MDKLYWLILFLWVGGIFYLKKDSRFALYPAFVLFIVSAVLTVIGFRNVAEPIMRVSFIGWLIGIFMALIEYKRSTRYN